MKIWNVCDWSQWSLDSISRKSLNKRCQSGRLSTCDGSRQGLCRNLFVECPCSALRYAVYERWMMLAWVQNSASVASITSGENQCPFFQTQYTRNHFISTISILPVPTRFIALMRMKSWPWTFLLPMLLEVKQVASTFRVFVVFSSRIVVEKSTRQGIRRDMSKLRCNTKIRERSKVLWRHLTQHTLGFLIAKSRENRKSCLTLYCTCMNDYCL